MAVSIKFKWPNKKNIDVIAPSEEEAFETLDRCIHEINHNAEPQEWGIFTKPDVSENQNDK